MSVSTPPYFARWKNQGGRGRLASLCGPSPTVLIRRPIAPPCTSSPAFTVERVDARLVDHVVLAVAHDLDAERRTLAADDGAHHQGDALVLEDAPSVGN